MAILGWNSVLRALGTLCLIPTTTYAKDTVYISGTGLDGVTRQNLAVDRRPSLYTGDFGDCLGGQSLLNVTKFDAAFYYDNSTVLFHLDGSTNIRSEAVMMYISVEAYGETRFEMTFDPCTVNIYSLCPMNATVPIEAFAYFQIGLQQISGIPQIAYEIPDFEGFARIQIFANSSRTEIGCFQAVMRNGNSFSQPKAVGSILGVFTAGAILASFLTAAYGVSIPHMRTHYAHSFSVLIVFETFQSIFFSGALSLNWPSVLPAWWSNFAWSAGLIPIASMTHSVDSFSGVSGNASQVGGAGSTIINNNGGLVQQIYGRSVSYLTRRIIPGLAEQGATLARRQQYNESDPYDYNWNGDPVTPGMPIPGDWSGFAGDLSGINIPALDAFMIAFIWLLIALGFVALLVTTFKFTLEGLVKFGWIKQDRYEFFRTHWTGYLSVSLLRTLFIAFSTMMVLIMFQFAHGGRAGPIVIASVVFVFFMLIIGGVVVYALWQRLRFGKFCSDPDRILFERTKVMGVMPWIRAVRHSQLGEKEFTKKPARSLPFVRWHFVDDNPNRTKVHQDVAYIKRFGWLSARYRVSRWWFFAFWMGHQFVRACFIGGATKNPLAQVFGLFIVDILSLCMVTFIDPYEGQRNKTLAVWLLGLVRIATTGLSFAFLPDFNLERITATVIGVVVIIMQALLVIAVMILIILGAFSTWFSLSRNREYFSAERLQNTRIKYYEHIELKALDRAAPPPEAKPEEAKKMRRRLSRRGSQRIANPEPEPVIEPSFNVNSVRRAPKIEDEDDDYLAEMEPVTAPATAVPTPGAPRRARTNSVSSRHSVSSLPRGARVHRVSWSSKDFQAWQAETQMDRPGPALARRLSQGPIKSTGALTGILKNEPSATSLRNTGTSIPGSRPMTPAREDMEDEEKEIKEVKDDLGKEPRSSSTPEPQDKPDYKKSETSV